MFHIVQSDASILQMHRAHPLAFRRRFIRPSGPLLDSCPGRFAATLFHCFTLALAMHTSGESVVQQC